MRNSIGMRVKVLLTAEEYDDQPYQEALPRGHDIAVIELANETPEVVTCPVVLDNVRDRFELAYDGPLVLQFLIEDFKDMFKYDQERREFITILLASIEHKGRSKFKAILVYGPVFATLNVVNLWKVD